MDQLPRIPAGRAFQGPPGVAHFRSSRVAGGATAENVVRLLGLTATLVADVAREQQRIAVRAMLFEQDPRESTAECIMTVFFDELG